MENDDLHPWLEACDLNQYPQGFLDDYEPFECLADTECAQTLLVKYKRTGMFYVAKCYRNDQAVSHTTEADILKKLQHTGLPRFVDEYQSASMLCVIREYVEGTPLHQWAADTGPDAAGAVRVALMLCELLMYLHGQTPPILHRDIKPQNLIVGTDGQLWLIDFGISRLYREDGKTDTACLGTQDFAPPEQYGFSQTDVRSDIYSFGVVLGYLLTGKAKRDEALAKIEDKRLFKIVEKCTAFAPVERYASAAKLRADLLALDGRRRRRVLARFFTAALCLVCLCGGFVVGRYTEWFQPPPEGVEFQEPLIGQAARLMLGLEAGAPVTPADLLSVSSLFICGEQIARDNQTLQDLINEAAVSHTVRNGAITSLEDLRLMPNLLVVCLVNQNISDLTALSSLKGLSILDLRHNPAADLTPLMGLKQLTSVTLYGTRVEDLSPLAACPLLDEISAGASDVTELESLRGCTALRKLWLPRTSLETLQGIAQILPGLMELQIATLADADLRPLLELESLRRLVLPESMKGQAERTLADAAFTIVYTQE
ncbi:MAG TPA: protein kinase [Candidatus Limiplasma sp.]|nr:protein kinase [Candidatus Limiplasma sp.]HRX08951.1 protein kinase [Candidatus Limiplasma sp.]